MTGTIQETWQDCLDHVRRPMRTVTIGWTSDGSGAVLQALTGGGSNGLLSGRIERVVFVPGTGGGEPTNNYGVAVYDESSVDLLAGQGAAKSNTAASDYRPNPAVAVDEVCTLSVSGAGAAKSGTVVIYLG